MKARDGSALRCGVALDNHDGLVGMGTVTLPMGSEIPVPLCEAHGYVPPEKPWSRRALYEHLKRALLRHVGPLGPIPSLPSDPNEGGKYIPRATTWRAWVHETVLDLVDTVDEFCEKETCPSAQFCADCGEPIERDVQACASTFGWCRPQGRG